LQLLHCRKPRQLTILRRLDICLHGYVALAAIEVRNRSRKNAFENVACSKGGPLKILDLQTKSAAIQDGSALVLSRPDQRVAWRNDPLPANPLALIDRVRGAASQCS
jgi:hypothetical protein